ncbi:MAG: GspE/PulE family protein [Patescibacteria group bacterium]
MFIDPVQMKKLISDSGLVTPADITDAEKSMKAAEVESKKVNMGEALMAAGKITEDDYRRMQAYLMAIPFVDLKTQKLSFDVLSLIPEPIARSHNIVAIKKKDDTLEVAMLDSDDLSAIDFIKKKTGLKILPRMTNTESMKAALIQYQKSLKADFGDIIQQEAATLKMVAQDGVSTGDDASADDLKKIAEDLPVIRIVDTLLKHAALQGASDIHIEQTETEVVVRYRIDGLLRDAMILPKSAGSSITARIKVLSSLKLDEKRLPQDGRFRIELNDEKISFRVSILPTYYGEKTVMRLLRETVSGFSLEGLGFHGLALDTIHEGTNMSEGMVLTTGPTGSGKTTTLYTVLDLLNKPDVNISTVEDPVEYQMKRINQTQVRPEIGFTFANGLRSLLRQDPDVIMVGEIRDNETASLAINAALTGHLVLSTLHTNSAAGAIPRLIDMKCEPFLLVSTLKVIVAQRLVRRLSKSKQSYFLTKEELALINKKIDMDRVLKALRDEKIIDEKLEWKDIPFYKPKGDAESDDGYHGRIGIHEVLRMSPTIKDLIIKGNTSDDIQEQARKEGMLTMIEDGIFQAVQGLTSIEEILRVVSE